jgi:hypothetical protein
MINNTLAKELERAKKRNEKLEDENMILLEKITEKNVEVDDLIADRNFWRKKAIGEKQHETK